MKEDVGWWNPGDRGGCLTCSDKERLERGQGGRAEARELRQWLLDVEEKPHNSLVSIAVLK